MGCGTVRYRGAVFDLDGVLVDTSKFHYLAWKELAEKLGFEFTPGQNERLKGVSRMESLDLLLRAGGLQGRFSQREKERLAAWKNRRYVERVRRMDASDLLDGAEDLLRTLRGAGVKTALGSASKNAPLVLRMTGILPLFDAVVDGNRITRAKPDPQVFLLGAAALGLAPEDCVVFEDSRAGLQAAKSAGMGAVGIGSPRTLGGADAVYPRLPEIELDRFFGIEPRKHR
ncbi:MAG TPA: beta-phosphoglucomutase [Ruminococcaceae bacterium]|nr:beta-phosphoglucomutase [Oscillospiraceae bacterium]